MSAEEAPLLQNYDQSDETSSNSKKSLTNWDIRSTWIRWVCLFNVCLMNFGAHFVYNFPAVMQPELQDKLNMSDLQYNGLYVIYSLPNIILPFFGGHVIDKYGVRFAMILFQIPTLIGVVVFATGVTCNLYEVAMLGRFVYGWGAQSFELVTITFIVNWFTRKEMAMSLGFAMSNGLLANVLNNILQPMMYEHSGDLILGVWVGVTICVGSFIFTWVVYFIDRKADILDPPETDSPVAKLSDVKQLPGIYWIIALHGSIMIIVIGSFNNVSSKFYQDRFGFPSLAAGILVSLISITGMIFAPILGIVVDAWGGQTKYLVWSGIFLTFSHVMYIFLPNCDMCLEDTYILLLIGFAWAMRNAIIWSSILHVIWAHIKGTSLGIFRCMNNFGLTVVPAIVGIIHDQTTEKHGWQMVSVLLAGLSFWSLLAAVFVFFWERMNHKIDARELMTMGKFETSFDEEPVQDAGRSQMAPVAGHMPVVGMLLALTFPKSVIQQEESDLQQPDEMTETIKWLYEYENKVDDILYSDKKVRSEETSLIQFLTERSATPHLGSQQLSASMAQPLSTSPLRMSQPLWAAPHDMSQTLSTSALRRSQPLSAGPDMSQTLSTSPLRRSQHPSATPYGVSSPLSHADLESTHDERPHQLSVAPTPFESSHSRGEAFHLSRNQHTLQKIVEERDAKIAWLELQLNEMSVAYENTLQDYRLETNHLAQKLRQTQKNSSLKDVYEIYELEILKLKNSVELLSNEITSIMTLTSANGSIEGKAEAVEAKLTIAQRQIQDMLEKGSSTRRSRLKSPRQVREQDAKLAAQQSYITNKENENLNLKHLNLGLQKNLSILKEKYDFLSQEHGVLHEAENKRVQKQDSARSSLAKNATLRKLQNIVKSKNFNQERAINFIDDLVFEFDEMNDILQQHRIREKNLLTQISQEKNN